MKQINTLKYLINNIIIYAFLLLILSCENDIKKVNLIGIKDNSPVESAKDVSIIFSDSGMIQAKLTCKQLNKFEGKDPYYELSKELVLLFYDPYLNVKSSLKANYGINYENRRIMEAKDNVEVINRKNEKLNTEHLIWDQRKKIIYSDKFVKVTTADEVLFGEGFESDETFDKWVIKKPKGTLTVKK